MSDIFQEIDEELRRDSFQKLWQRYGKYLVVVALLIVAGTAGVAWWRQHDLQQREAEGSRFAAALDVARTGKMSDAADALLALASNAHPGQAVMARFEAAAIRARAGDQAGAIAAYDAIAKDASIDEIYRGLATVLWGLHAVDGADPQSVIDRMAPLTGAENPWHPSAIEVTAIAHLKAGDQKAARSSYQRLADDLGAPAGMRARAAEMVAALAS